jgi:hypothetical protein
MQQTCKSGFRPHAERSGEAFGECRDIAEMGGQRLPTVFSVIA